MTIGVLLGIQRSTVFDIAALDLSSTMQWANGMTMAWADGTSMQWG